MKKRFLTIICTLTIGLSLLITSHANVSASEVKRLSGNDRYQTCSAIVNEGWSSSDYAVVVNGENFPDALSAAVLAKKYKAPILLTENNKLNSNACDQLKRLNVGQVFIVGGDSVVNPNVENAINKLNIKTTRYKGMDRTETSIEVAKQIGTQNGIILTTDNDFTDALSAAPIAAKLQIPIILMPKDSMPDSVSKFIAGKNIPKTYVLGGQDLISNQTASNFPNVQRIEGSSKYERNVNIINAFVNEFNFNDAYLAYSEKFADALSGSALAALNGNPIILTGDIPSEVTKNFISNKKLCNLKVLGGNAGINQPTVDKLLNTSTSVSTKNQSMYSAYYNILQQKITEYGMLPLYGYLDTARNEKWLSQINGVAYAALVNFDEDDKDELFICYNNAQSGLDRCTYEIWGYNGSPYLIAKKEAEVFGGGHGAWSYLELHKQDKNSYVIIHEIDKSISSMGAVYHSHYTYSNIVSGNLMTNEIDRTDLRGIDNSNLPWSGAECIIKFSDYVYFQEDRDKLLDFIAKLKEYSK